MTRGPATGARIGPAIAEVVARAMVAHEDQTHHRKKHLAHETRAEFLEGLEAHLTPYLGEMWKAVAGDESMPAWLRDMAAEIAEPGHQFTALLQFAAIALSLFSLAGAITRPLAEKLEQDRNQDTPHMLVSPPELALGQVKGVQSRIDPYMEALKGGYDAERLDYLTAITGEPPSIQDLLFLRRRGHIDDERLNHGIRQSRLRNEWTDAIHALTYVPVSAQEAVVAVLKGHMTRDEGRKVFGENGIDPVFFDAMVATAGRPVGIQEALQLLNRGVIDEGRVGQIVRQSDVNDAFLPEVLHLRVHYPPPRSVPALVKAKAISKERGAELLRFAGYPADLADAVIAAATHEKGAAGKALSMGTVHQLYTERIIDKAKATQLLDADKFDAEEIGELFALWDHEQTARQQAAAITAVRARYLARHTDRPAASAALDRIGVPALDRDSLIRLWDVELEVSARQLSEAQIIRIWTAGVRPRQWAHDRLVASGLTAEDTDLLLDTYAPRGGGG